MTREQVETARSLHEQGELDDAAAIYEEVLRNSPRSVVALHGLALVAIQRNEFRKGEELLHRALAIDQTNADLYNHLGAAVGSQGRMEEAISSFQRSIDLNPMSCEAYYNLANAYRGAGQTENAIDHYQAALGIRKDYAEALFNLANSLRELKRFEEAVEHYRLAQQARPNYGRAANGEAICLRELDRMPEAADRFRQAIRCDPNYTKAHHHLGGVLRSLGELDEAVTSYQKSLELEPDFAEAHSNLGAVYQDMGELDAAQIQFEQALRLQPDMAPAHVGRALTRMRKGDLDACSWLEFEWRWLQAGCQQRQFEKPLWDGFDLAGKRILLLVEQGVGDTLQFIRYASRLQQRGAEVVVECQKSLIGLLSRTPGISRLVPRGEPLPDFDTFAPLLSLPGIVKTTLDSIPCETPYVFADQQLAAYWKERLSDLEGLRVGIAWQGNPEYALDHFRSIPLVHFQRLAEIPGVKLISLQKGSGCGQLAGIAGRFHVTDFSDELDEKAGPFMDTAAIMMSLDLVVTSDTAIPHLAGALGVPVWMAVPLTADWRWLIDRGDSPWYPSMRLFRQQQIRQWQPVFEEVASELRGLARGDRSKLQAPRRQVDRISVPAAAGELIDKITILEIARHKTSGAGRLAQIQAELRSLERLLDDVPPSPQLFELRRELKGVNEQLWRIEQDIRVCEREQNFDARIVELLRNAIRHEDRRASLKRQIDALLRSEIVAKPWSAGASRQDV